MCGRFVGYRNLDELKMFFPIDKAACEVTSNFNVAPSQEILTIFKQDGKNWLDKFHWGLVPFWTKDPSIGNRMINARAETVHRKPAYRGAFKYRRCLIPASGFYEWDKLGGSRQPYYISRSDGRPLALAGLWEARADCQSGEVLESCTILTTSANQTLGRIHDRMPVILEQDDCGLWLDHRVQRTEELTGLFRPAAEEILQMTSVSTYVNKAGHEGAVCVAPVAAG